MKRISQWLAHRRADRDNAEFRKGFDYAAGKLLFSDGDRNVIEDLEHEGDHYTNDSMHAKGIRSALDSWYRAVRPRYAK